MLCSYIIVLLTKSHFFLGEGEKCLNDHNGDLGQQLRVEELVLNCFSD